MAINWKQGKEVIDLAKTKNLFFGEVSLKKVVEPLMRRHKSRQVGIHTK